MLSGLPALSPASPRQERQPRMDEITLKRSRWFHLRVMAYLFCGAELVLLAAILLSSAGIAFNAEYIPQLTNLSFTLSAPIVLYGGGSAASAYQRTKKGN